MLNRIIDASVSNRLIVVIGLSVICLVAAITIPDLKLDAFPDVTNVQVTVNTEARGLAATEVEQLITYPIESVMYSMPSVKQVRSISKTGLSIVTIVFKEGTDIEFARNLVFQKLAEAKERIPAGIGVPNLGPNTTGLGQVYQYILRSKIPGKYSTMQLRSINDWAVKLALMPEPGVTEVLSFGGEVKQYQVLVNPNALISHKLTLQQVINKIEQNNRNAGGWYLKRGAEQLVIRGVGWVRSGNDGINDIRNIPLKSDDGKVVRVRDIARVALGAEIRQGAVSMSKKTATGRVTQHGEVVAGIVLKRWGANTHLTIEGVKQRLKNLTLQSGVVLEPYYDQADLVDQAVQTVTNALLIAFGLILVILLLFLLNLRVTFLVMLSIPVSSGIALMCMSIWDLSANLMTLGGLTIAIGMMVDGSVVMLENIYSHISKKTTDTDSAGGIPLRIQEACKEVGRPVFFAALIVVIVFAPLFTLEGVEGKMFKPMAVSIVIAMISALAVALIIVPALATYLFRRPVAQSGSPLLRPLEQLYQGFLARILKRRKAVILLLSGLVLSSVLVAFSLGTEFVPELEEGTLNVRVTLAPSSSLKTSTEVAKKMENILMQFPEVTYALSRIGRPELGGDPEPVSNVEIYVGLKPVSQWVSARTRYELQAKMEKAMSVHSGLLFTFSQPIATRVDELLSGVKAQLAIKLFGPDLKQLEHFGKRIEALVRNVKGSQGVALEPIGGEAQLAIRPRRDKLAFYNIAVSDVMSTVADSIGGQTAGQVIRGNERYDIYVRLDARFRSNISAIKRLVLVSQKGEEVLLGDVAEVTIEQGPPQIRRDNVQRRVVIQANVTGRDMGGFVDEIKRRIKQTIELPDGYYTEFGGQYQNQKRALERLSIVVPVSLALIFLMLYLAFNSIGQVLLIMLSVPLALLGGVFSLFVTGQYLSVPGSIGFITLFGVAVLNGVVLVSAINQRVTSAELIESAILDGAYSRLRPVLMTALTTVLGLAPMLFASGVGSEIQKPLATVVVGGMFSATFLTLVILPVLYQPFSSSRLKSLYTG